MRVVEVELARVDVTAAEQMLDDSERVRAAAFLRSADRDRYVASHVAFRSIVATCLDVAPAEVEIVRGCLHCGDPSHGKPRVGAAGLGAGEALDVSLSHAGGLAVVALVAAPARVGVDVERERLNLDWSEILGEPCPDARTGLLRWTRAEAVLKAAGLGLVARPRIDDVADRDGWRPASVPGAAASWFVRDMPVRAAGGYALAVSVDMPNAVPQSETWPEIVSSRQDADNAGGCRSGSVGLGRADKDGIRPTVG